MKRETKALAALLASIPLVIVGAASACTWAIAHGASMQLRLLFRLICHGIPERCFMLWGVPMPLCARCVAIYAGLAVGIIAFRALPSLTELAARRVMFAAAIPLVIDGLTQLARLRESTNLLRLETGLLAGTAFAYWALTAVDRVVLTTSSPEID